MRRDYVNMKLLHATFNHLGSLSDGQCEKVVFLAISASGDIHACLIPRLQLTLRDYYLIYVVHVPQTVLELMKTDLVLNRLGLVRGQDQLLEITQVSLVISEIRPVC